MKIFKNRMFLGILCIVAGLVAGFIILPAATNNAAETRPVLLLKAAVPAGAQITADMVTVQELPKSAFVGALTKADDAVGRYAAADLFAGDVLSASKLYDSLEAMDIMAAATEKDRQIVSVTLPSLAAGVSGRLQPGDTVAVMATPKNSGQSLGLDPDTEVTGQTGKTMVVTGLERLEICMVTTSDAADARINAFPAENEKNTLPVTISFYVTPQQALVLAELEQDSTIHLAFVSRGSLDGIAVGTEGD